MFPIVFITYFNETIDNLFKKYVHHQKESIYGKIYIFNQVLQSYKEYLGCHMKPGDSNVEDYYIPLYHETNFEWEHDFGVKVLEYRKAINGLYGEVCDGETMFVECGSM